MEPAITIGGTAIVFVGLALTLGYLGQKLFGAILLGFGALVAAAVTAAGALTGYNLAGGTGAWVGLVTGIVLGRMLVAPLLGKIIKGRSGRFIGGLWIGFCALSIFGYLAGRWVGLLTLTLPAILLFWLGLYFIAPKLLPLPNKKDKNQRRKVFRALLTFSMGTNYPYYVVDENSEPVKQVDGNPFGKIFSGPGFVMTGCDHTAYITDGLFVKGVFEPGLTFTGIYDLEPKIIDLRPQLRAFPVEALTKDGIPIEVATFIPYKIDGGRQTIEPGRSFPFRQSAIYQALAGELVKRKPDIGDHESGQKHTWDGGPEDGLVPLLVTPIVQDIVGRYTVDELCAPDDPERDPRQEIRTELVKRAQQALRPRGLDVMGGGIGNLVPQSDLVKKRRLDNWRTEWVGQMLSALGKSQTDRLERIEETRLWAAVEMVNRFSQEVKPDMRGNLPSALALGFINAVGDVVAEGDDQWPLPNEQIKTILKKLRGEE